jgi:hypothetical protein
MVTPYVQNPRVPFNAAVLIVSGTALVLAPALLLLLLPPEATPVPVLVPDMGWLLPSVSEA